MELNVEKIIELYNQRVAQLEHENILLKVQLQQLQEKESKVEND